MDKNKILTALSVSDNVKCGKEDFKSQSVPQKVFSSLWAVEAEVNNGGFSQYFFNGSSETAEFVVQALEIIGAPRTADICKRAITCAFPAGLPLDPEEISAAAAHFSDQTAAKLEELSDAFSDYPHNLTDLLFAYVSAHPEEFGPLPKPS